MYNQIISNAGMLTDTKARAMISTNLRNGEISPNDAELIKNMLGL